MNSLRLLLIEDSPHDATLFIDQIQNSLGNEVEVEWKTCLSDAMSLLEAGQIFDQIWVDPGLSDLSQQNIGKALSALKKYVQSGELRLISNTSSAAVARQAAQHNVEVLQKDALVSTNNQILAVVQQMLAKRSSSYSTAHVELARLEGIIAKLEYQVSENSKTIASILTTLEQLRTVPFELASIKDILRSQSETADKSASANKEVKVKRLDLLQAIILALIAALSSASIIVLPKVADRWFVAPPTAPTPSSAPTVSPPTTPLLAN